MFSINRFREYNWLIFAAQTQLCIHGLAHGVDLQAVHHLDIFALVDDSRSTGLVFQHIIWTLSGSASSVRRRV